MSDLIIPGTLLADSKHTGASEQRLRVGWLIDGRGEGAVTDRLLVLEKGVIKAIEPFDPTHPGHANAVDLSGFTLLPALMDAHVHLCFAGLRDPQQRRWQLAQTQPVALTAIGRHLEQHVLNGITAVRDGGDRHGYTWQYKQQLPDAGMMPLDILVADRAWHARGRYGQMLGRAPQEGEALAEALLAEHRRIDHVKLINSGINSLEAYGKQTPPQFKPAELKAAVQAAATRNLPVMVHANGQKAVCAAIEAGCRSIEHGYFMGADNLAFMADKKIYWVPTAVPMAVLAQDKALAPKQRDVAFKTLDGQMSQIAQACTSGVTIVLGTDAGSMGVDHGTAVWQELNLLVEAGLSLEKAVQSATLNAACLMRLENRGALISGWRADLLVVSGPPENLLRGTDCLKGKCLQGQWQYHPLDRFSADRMAD